MHICISIAHPNEEPSIMVANNYAAPLPRYHELFSVTIPAELSETPKIVGKVGEIEEGDLRSVFQYIHINRDVLLSHWYQMQGCQTYAERLRPLCEVGVLS